MIREGDLGLVGALVFCVLCKVHKSRSKEGQGTLQAEQSDTIARDGEELFEWTAESKM
jgi:hypothetical protein